MSLVRSHVIILRKVKRHCISTPLFVVIVHPRLYLFCHFDCTICSSGGGMSVLIPVFSITQGIRSFLKNYFFKNLILVLIMNSDYIKKGLA